MNNYIIKKLVVKKVKKAACFKWTYGLSGNDIEMQRFLNRTQFVYEISSFIIMPKLYSMIIILCNMYGWLMIEIL